MKVLYDHQVFSWQRFGGISRYFYELMNHCTGLFEYETSGIFSDNEYIKPLQLYKIFPIHLNNRGRIRIINYFNKRNTIKRLRTKEYDIIHPTYYDPYVLKYSRKYKIVIDVHDMIFEKFPDQFKNIKRIIEKKRRYFFCSDKIIANSQRTKEDLLDIYSEIPENKVAVIYRGNVFSNKIIGLEQDKECYILFTGQRSGYKNFYRFIVAIAPLLIHYDLQLLCTGQAFTRKESDLLRQYNVYDRTHCQFVKDDELWKIYANALVFVFPSLYEGFGFPILEAFSAGCPAILSNTSCFPEIAENAAIYFDPYDIEDMRRVIEKAILDSSLRQILIKKGYERVNYFSWEKTVKETFQVYKEVLL
jgi:glycosyltransferase involved in cell wall biosynthesis